jgi:hypothetical protein
MTFFRIGVVSSHRLVELVESMKHQHKASYDEVSVLRNIEH